MILLDTHTLVWLELEPNRLSAAATSAIRQARREDGVAVAAITLWELALLLSRGRVKAQGTLEVSVRMFVEHAGVQIKPLTPQIAAASQEFPKNFSLADRLIAATARAEGIPLVTRDERIRKSTLLRTIW